MVRRTTIELDDELLERARQALGQSTTRATVEEALRRATESAEAEHRSRVEKQRRYFAELAEHCDLDVLAGDDMWA
jgi:Arc/MetJ family transcription regulator